MAKKKKKGIRKVFAIIGIAVGGLLATVLTLAVGLVAYLSITEYKPRELDELSINNNPSNKVSLNTNYNLISWNVGYCALDENSDFFMDGGSMVRANSKEQVKNNAEEIANATASQNVDFVFYQEVDEDSHRSKRVNEVDIFASKFSNFGYTYAYNYTYDANGNILTQQFCSRVDSSGKCTAYSYTSYYTYDANGNKLTLRNCSSVDSNGNCTAYSGGSDYTYDDNGKQIAFQPCNGSNINTTTGECMAYDYTTVYGN